MEHRTSSVETDRGLGEATNGRYGWSRAKWFGIGTSRHLLRMFAVLN